MARDLTNDFITEITKYSPNSFTPILLIDAAFDSGNLRLWNGVGDLSYGGNTYLGSLPVLSLSGIKENKDITAAGLQITLTGLDSTILDLAHDEPYQNRSLELYIAMLDSSGAVIGDPYLMFEGFMDTMQIRDDGRTIDVTVNVENALIALERALDSKYTSEDQKKEFSGDTGLDFITEIQDKEVVWE